MSRFITFEGLDKVGKTTIVQNIYTYLVQMNIPVVKFYEPGGSEYANAIRNILKYKQTNEYAKLYAFISARYDHIEAIEQYLQNNFIVLCDRYIHSTLAYQGSILSYEYVKKILDFVNHRKPDLTFLIEGKRFIDEEGDYLEKMNRNKISSIFDLIKKAEKEKICVINNEKIDYKFIINKILEDIGIEPTTPSV